MGQAAPSCIHNFSDRVGTWSNFLEVDGKDTKKKHLDGGTRGIPGGAISNNSVSVVHIVTTRDKARHVFAHRSRDFRIWFEKMPDERREPEGFRSPLTRWE